eukprot:COSAG01_NODE_16912_length_1194_cov_1.768037_1_plen_46_part_10
MVAWSGHLTPLTEAITAPPGITWQNVRLQTVRAGFNARFGEQEIYD